MTKDRFQKIAGELGDFFRRGAKEFGSALMPIPPASLKALTPEEETQRMFKHVGKSAISWATLAAVLRILQQSTVSKEPGNKMKNYINARFPIISLDPDDTDTDKEDKLRDIATELHKTASEGSFSDNMFNMLKIGADEEEGPLLWSTLAAIGADIKKLFQGGAKSFKDVKKNPYVQGLQSEEKSPYHIPLVSLAAIFSAYGGYRGADNLIDTLRKRKAEKVSETKRNELDKILYDEYMRTRGLDKVSKEDPSNSTTTTTSNASEAPEGGNPWEGMKAAYGTYAGISMVLSYLWLRKYFERQSPNRRRMEILQNIEKDRAKLKEPPVLFTTGLPKSKEPLKELKGNISLEDTSRKPVPESNFSLI